jgi:hypothetical protein
MSMIMGVMITEASPAIQLTMLILPPTLGDWQIISTQWAI